jgi:hypothetical protein
MSSILVGLDLAPSSRAASQGAAQHARLIGRRLLAIDAVPIPPASIAQSPHDNSSKRPQGWETEVLLVSLHTPQTWCNDET